MLSDKEKIQNIYNKRKNRNYNNPLFPTLNVDIKMNNPFINQTSNYLEGFDGNESNPENRYHNNEVSTRKVSIFGNVSISGNGYNTNKVNTGNTRNTGKVSIFGNAFYRGNKIIGNVVNTPNNIFKDISNSTIASASKDSVKNFQSLATNNVNSINSTFICGFNNPSNAGKSANDKRYRDSIKKKTTISFINFLKSCKNFFAFFVNFISNFFIYISIIIVQLSYGVVPIQPFGNINKPLTLPNWPWKLNLDVSNKDNLSKNKSAKLIDPNTGPIFVNGKYIPAEIYHENQKILHDSNIVFSVVIQLLLVSIVSFVFTNNAYYYVYKDSTSFPYRVIQPKNITKDGQIEIENDVSLIIYTITNTLVCAPHDVLIGTFRIYKWFTQLSFIGLYTFPALNYIIMFLCILYFNLHYFWDFYNYLINNLSIWDLNSFYVIFVIYGLIMHYFMVSKISGTGKMYTSIYVFAGTVLYRLLIFAIIVSFLMAAYPLIRLLFYVWFIYIFFGLYGFTSDTYNDIIHYEHTNKCKHNTFKFTTFIRDTINTFYKYFFYFVIFILVFSVFNYLKSQKMFNTNSSSAMKLLISIIFLCVFIYLIYSILNKTTPKYQNKVVYGKSFLQDKMDIPVKLKETVDNLIIPNIDVPLNKIKITGASKDIIDKIPNEKPGVKNVSKKDKNINKLQNISIDPPPKGGYSNNNDVETFSTVEIQKEEEEIENKNIDNSHDENMDNSQNENIDNSQNENIDNSQDENIENKNMHSSMQNRLNSMNPLNMNVLNNNIIENIPGLKNNISIFTGKFKEIFNILNQNIEDPLIKELLNKPINIENLEKEIEIKLNTSNVINVEYLKKLRTFIDEIRKQEIDINIFNFISKLGNILFTEKSIDIQTRINEITQIFNEEIGNINDKLGTVLKNVFPNEINILIRVTQIYNSGAQPLFVPIEPEIRIVCFIISNIYSNETKSSILNIPISAASIGVSIIKLRM